MGDTHFPQKYGTARIYFKKQFSAVTVQQWRDATMARHHTSTDAVCRSRRCPARCAALRGAARRCGAARSSCRCGLLVPYARSAAEPRALRLAATGCWCPVLAPPPGGRPRRRRHSNTHLTVRSGLTRGNADSAATTPRSNTPLFLAACNAGSKGFVLLLTLWRAPFAAPCMQGSP